ncbi:MAG: GIY-YIG nuclease family protein, partial [Microcoleus sp. SIO2G3]|nr:GIY-YIG nuclease family protein [Microcoleus sp. SIO2G3]
MSRSLAPLQLPSVPLAQRNQLPTCSAIYFAIDANDRVLYVGKAKNLATRWQNHHRLHKLKEIDQQVPVRLAWQAWNEADLSAAEKSFIINLQPLLNNTEVEAPAVIPSEVALRQFLKTFSRRLIIFGIQPKTADQLLSVDLKYDWTDCSARGTAAKIKAYIQQHRGQNTSLKFKWHRYSN